MSYVGGITGGVVERFLPGDRLTCTVAAGQAVVGGNVVEATADYTVQQAGAASVVVLGVALHDAAAGTIVTVATAGVWVIISAGAITAGSRVVTGAAGVVAAAGAAPDARTVIGFALAAAAANLCQVKLIL